MALVWGEEGVGSSYVTASGWSDSYTPDQAFLDNRNGHWKTGPSRNSGNWIGVSTN